MKKRRAVLVALFGVLASVFGFGVPTATMAQTAGAQTATPFQTRFTPLDESLESLLNRGAQIRASSPGYFVLSIQSSSPASSGRTGWAFCWLNVAAGLASGEGGNYRAPTSVCYGLN